MAPEHGDHLRAVLRRPVKRQAPLSSQRITRLQIRRDRIRRLILKPKQLYRGDYGAFICNLSELRLDFRIQQL